MPHKVYLNGGICYMSTLPSVSNVHLKYEKDKQLTNLCKVIDAHVVLSILDLHT